MGLTVNVQNVHMLCNKHIVLQQAQVQGNGFLSFLVEKLIEQSSSLKFPLNIMLTCLSLTILLQYKNYLAMD